MCDNSCATYGFFIIIYKQKLVSMKRQNKLLVASTGVWIACSLFVSCKRELVQQPAPEKNTAYLSANVTTTKNGPLGVVYVEVNNNNFRNVAAYTLKNGGQPLFDIAVIFAANINYDATLGKAVLYNNPNVTTVLSDTATYIKPLHDKGIKVLLSILGNHQGAGICNFTSRAAAHDFAQQLASAVNTYHLDGIDFDDEYAEYGQHGQPGANDSSFVLLLSELRSLMPSKIISFYYYGPAASRQQWNNQKAGDFVNYSWNAIYGTYSAPNVPGLTKSQLSAAATWINNTSMSTAKTMAQQTKTDGYGVYLYYDLPGTDVQTYLSAVSTALYNDSTKLTSPLQPWPPTTGSTTGVNFYQDINYGGTATQAIPKGNYTLAQLQGYGFVNDWASSVKIPTGWTVTLYSNDNFSGTSWTLTANTASFVNLVPNANDVVSSVRIQ
jgi:hypothetical protein